MPTSFLEDGVIINTPCPDSIEHPRYVGTAVPPTPTPAVDMVNEPPHYKHASGIEAIQITEHENFCIGNAIKYLMRCDKKGSPLEDLRKAQYYVNREILRREV